MEFAQNLKRPTVALADLDPSESQRPPSLVPQIELVEFARIISRQKWIILGTMTLVTLLGAIIIFSLAPRYMATTFVEISPRQANIVDFEAVLSGLPADNATMATEIQILRSRNLADKTITKLELDRDPEFNPALRAPGLVSRFSEWILGVSQDRRAEDGGDLQNGQVPKAEEDPSFNIRKILGLLPARWRSAETSRESPAEQAQQERSTVIDVFLEKLSVAPQGRSRVIGITIETETPRMAAAAANTLADFYIVAQLEAKFEAAKRANAWLSDRIMKLRDEVSMAEQAVESFRKGSGLIRGGTNATLVGEQVSELNRQLVTERATRAEAEARVRQVEKLLKQPRGIETIGDVLTSNLIRDLRRQETVVERQVAELFTEYGERHPRMINARAELGDIEAKIREEVDKIVQGLRNEVAVVRARSTSLNKALGDLKKEIAGLNASEVQLRAFEREAAASRALLERLLTRSKETSSQENFQQADANVISSAAVPRVPSFPKKGILLILSFAVATVLGVSLAMALEYLDFGFRSTEQVERILGMAPLGLVPALKGLKTVGSEPHDYVLDNPTSAYAESIRNLYTNLLLLEVSKRPKVILFASALPNEGKTSVALSLARLQANIGQKVVVVDGDVRRPSAHTALKIPPGPGLVDYLLGEASLDQVTQKDPRSSLHILQAGNTRVNSADLLDTVSMQKLLRNLAKRYDLVIIDSAPLMAVSDTLFLSRFTDKTVVLVRWKQSSRETTKLVLNRLLNAQCDVAGVLLTRVNVKEHAKYGYGDSGTYHGKLKRYYSS